MIFNSLDFAVFLPIVFLIYWNVKQKRVVLLLASYFFYGYWNYKFLFLIFLSSLFDYLIALELSKTPAAAKNKRLLWIGTSVVFNLGVLVYFKYLNFFIESFSESIRWFGFSLATQHLDIILPVGISFYTFQTLSYTIDVYRKEIPPTKNLLSFLCFVSFFPQLVAGPIEKAKNLLFQFEKDKTLDPNSISDGLRQLLWGFFQKVVVADNAAPFVNHIFENYTEQNSSTLFFGLFVFSIQIYCDFAGYSHIAIGVAKLFGYTLKQNFSYPYFSRNFHEFWKRWHISLTDWFRTYVYITIGGNRKGTIFQLRNIWIVFLLSGLWHGANMTFVVWGALHGLLYLPFVWRKSKNKYASAGINLDSPTILKEFIGLLLTNFLLCITWLFFRAKDLSTAIGYLKRLVFNNYGDVRIKLPYLQISPLILFFLILVFLLVEWQTRTKNHPLENLKYSIFKRYALYYALIAAIFWFGARSEEFLYFQF